MKQLTKEIIDEVSLETGIAPSYIEKDWYLVQVLDIISSLDTDKVKAVFAGGTSLSKGHDIIQRFSEDIDFSIIGLEDANRKERSKYKNALIEAINATDTLKVEQDSIFSRDENRFINFYVDYPKEFALEESLRNNLKLELSFKTTHLPPVVKKIKSFVSDYVPDCPSVSMGCISTVETAANKFSALMWRVDIKDRSKTFDHMYNDPALMRHLHDLSALYPMIKDDADFVRLVKEIYEIDKKRGDKSRDISLLDFMHQTLSTLRTDPIYKEEFNQFVRTMSYFSETETDFNKALHNYERLISLFK